MKQLNRWVLTCQNRVANIWYNQDYTVYGLNPTAGPQHPDNTNTVTVYDVTGETDQYGGEITLQIPVSGGPNPYAWISVMPAYDPLNSHLTFQDPNGGYWRGSWTSFQPIPTGDGYFALYAPGWRLYVAIEPHPDSAASNCNVLSCLADDISHAARFTAIGLDRPVALDLLDSQATLSKNASGISFRGVDLTGRDLSGWNLSGCDFRRVVSLSGCNMSGANLQGAWFGGLKNFNGVNLSGADCTAADFSGCDFTGIKPATAPPVLNRAVLTGVFVPPGTSWPGPGAKMAGAVLAQARLLGCNLSSAATDLSGANFNGHGVSYFTPVYPGTFNYAIPNADNKAIAYDYTSSGKLDHLVYYQPGPIHNTVWIAQRNADGSVTPVYDQNGIGGWDLADPADRIIAYDYAGTGHLDHLVCYRPGSGAIYIVKKVKDTDSGDAFTYVYGQGDSPSAQGIGGYNLKDPADRIIAYDYAGTGHLDHLVCYRPGQKTIWILRKANDTNSPDAFVPVYHQGGGPGAQGIGGYNLGDPADQIIAYDYAGTGRQDHLACYRPGSGMIWILKRVSDEDDPGAFVPVYQSNGPAQGIGGYDLGDPADQIIAYDYAGTGHLDHLVCYRPGSANGMIRIVRKVSDANDPTAFDPVYRGGGLGSGIGDRAIGLPVYDLADNSDRIVSCDLDGAGKPGYLVCYRPTQDVLWIVQNKAAGPALLSGCRLDQANLSGVSLAGFDLTAVTLSGANLSGASLAGAKLRPLADLTNTKLAGADLTGLNLSMFHFSFPLARSTDPAHPTIFAQCTLPYSMIAKDWSCLDLTGATITGMPANAAGRLDLAGLNAQGMRRLKGDFSKAILDGANFAGASLDGANFTGTSLLANASFAGAMMPSAFFVEAVLNHTDFTGATLDGADKTEAANFSYACLSNCIFTGGLYAVIFTGATLIQLKLVSSSGVNLEQADFSNAYLPNADFTNASLKGARFDGSFMVGCVLANADLTPAAGGDIQSSLAGACLQGATFDGIKLGGANLPNAAITTEDGQISVQYYRVPGSLTQAYPMPYSGGSYPDPSSLSDSTVCPNGITYANNAGKTLAQMMSAPNPPTQWKPRNTLEDESRLAASIISGAADPTAPADPSRP